MIVSESPNVFSYLRKGLLFYITAIQETFGDTLTSELFAIFAVNPVVVIELKSTKALTLPYLYISEPLRMQHRTVGIFENGFLKVISIFNILFAGMVTNSLNPACRLLFNSLSELQTKPLPPIRHICGLGASVGCERVERTFNTPRLKAQIWLMKFTGF